MRERGEGSVFKRTRRGRTVYVAQLSGSGGKQFTGDTAREAMRLRDEWIRDNGKPVATLAASDTVATYLPTWLTLASVDLAPQTIATYRGLISNHIAPAIGTVTLRQIGPAHVEAVLHAMRDLSPATRVKAYDVLSMAFRRARKLRLIRTNPCNDVDRPNVPRVKGRAIQLEHLTAFLSLIEGDRLEALWLLYLATGLRRGEALALSRDDVTITREEEVTSGVVRVRRSLQRSAGELRFRAPKTEAGVRTIALPEIAAEAIRRHLIRQGEERLAMGAAWHNEHDLVFVTRIGTPLEPRNVYRRFVGLCKLAGIPHYRLHHTRHTAASLMLREGANVYDVSATMGHARASITLDVYAHEIGREDGIAARQDAALRKAKGRD